MKRRYDYDILRVISMLGVIYLHTAADCLQNPNHVSVWNFSNFVTAFATPAVPIFFMMSGALLLSSDQATDIRVLFRRRIPKLLIPLCTWSALILLYDAMSGDFAGALESLQNILRTPAAVPYWFLYALIPMYLLSPMLKMMTDHLTQAHWNYMMALWIICTLGLYTLRSFVPDAWVSVFSVHWTLNLDLIGGYLGYFLLGAYLERLKRIPSKKILAAAIVVMLAISILGTRWDTYSHMVYSDRFTNYLSLFTFLLSAAIFLFAKSCLRGKEKTGKLLPMLSGVSFCVYLLHPLALGAAKQLWSHFTGLATLASIGQQLFLYLCVALFCITASVILSSIKPLCYLFSGQTFSAACKSSNLFALFSRHPEA